MRLAKRAVILLITTVALFSGYLLAQEGVIAQAYATVNVRRGPGTQYDIIGQLTSGNEVQITGRSDEESNWLRINFSGSEGWVAYFTVSVLGNTDQLPVVVSRSEQETTSVRPTVIPVPTQVLDGVFVTAYRAVNVRSGPGTEYVPIGTLEPGTVTEVTGRSNDSEWLRVDLDGTNGWVAFFVVSVSGLLEDIEVVQVSPGAATETPLMTVTVVTRYNVNLRENPTLNSPVVNLVPFGSTLEANARSDMTDSWLRVTYNNQIGWLIRALVDAQGNLDILPVARETLR